MHQLRRAPFRRSLHAPLTWWQEMRLPRPERQAARAERAAENQMRRERDNEHSAERRADAAAAERSGRIDNFPGYGG